MWTIDDPLVAESRVVSPTDPAVHEVRSNATTTTTPRTLQVHRDTVADSTPDRTLIGMSVNPDSGMADVRS